MIFRRGRKRAEEPDPGEQEPDKDLTEDVAEDEDSGPATAAESGTSTGALVGSADASTNGSRRPAEPDIDVAALDARDWRADGPYDIEEVDLEADTEDDPPRIDLGSMVLTGFPGAELRLQVAEETQQIVSAMLVNGDSALELGAYAAPRSGGLWTELRDEIIESATEAGGSAALVEGPFGVELRRLLPVTDAGRRAGLPAVQDVGGRRPAMAAARHRLRPGGARGGPESPVAEVVAGIPQGRRPPRRRGDGAGGPAAADHAGTGPGRAGLTETVTCSNACGRWLTTVPCWMSGSDEAMAKENMLQRALRRFASSNAELESEELQQNVRDEGAVPIRTCEDRQQVQLTGTSPR